MADVPYGHYGGGTRQQQQHFYYQHNHQPRHLARSGSPVNNGRASYANDTPSPSRSPVTQASSHPFSMFGQGQGQNSSMMNGNGSHQRYIQMANAHKYQQSSHQAHHSQQAHHQHNHSGHPGHGGLGHQHTYSSGMMPPSNQNYNSNGLQHNGAITDDHSDILEHYPEHWQEQLRLASEARQSSVAQHRHSKLRNAVALSARTASQTQNEESQQREGEQSERNRALTTNEGTGQEWDGMDLSGQGLRNITPLIGTNYSFITKLYIDNNKLAALPEALGRLRHLTILNASNNQLRELPNWIGMLSRLEKLLVFDNHIRVLPYEVGHLYKLDTLGIEGNPLNEDTKDYLIQNGTEELVVYIRDKTEAGPPPPPRLRIILDDSEAAETFSILDYNILCDKYTTPLQYPYAPTKALQWDYRENLILEEIKSQDADIVCLQELDQESYNESFGRELSFYGYNKGAFWPKSRARTMADREARQVDGCAIFFKGKKFILLDKQMIDFSNIAINRPDMKGGHDVFNRVMPRDNIAVVCFFENRMTGSRLIVANTHTHWGPFDHDVKLVQTAILMEQITKFACKWASRAPCTEKEKTVFRHAEQDSETDAEDAGPPAEPVPSLEYASGPQIPVIIAGDFNSEKGSGVCELLSQGSIPHDHPDLADRKYGDFTRDGMSHEFKLRSAYIAEPYDYIDFTNYTPGFSGTIDHIWHSTSLHPRQLLGGVNPEYLKSVPGFPNFHFPSDHLALFAEFSVEPRKERAKVADTDSTAQRDRRS